MATRDASGLTYQGSDALGTPVAALNTSTGVVGEQLFAPYGQARYNASAPTNGGLHTSLGFTGQHADTGFPGASGLDYFGARYLDPVVGRFTRADDVYPHLHDPAGLDPYAYVQGMVESATDPSGHFLDTQVGGGAGGMSAAEGELAIDAAANLEPTMVEFESGVESGVGDWVTSLESGGADAAATDAAGGGTPPGPGEGPGGMASSSSSGDLGGDTATGGAGGNDGPGAGSAADSSGTGPTVKVGDLQPLHSPEVSGPRPELERLSDGDLLRSVNDPANNDPLRINTRTGKLMDGNGRAYELMRRAADPNSIITPDTEVQYEPYVPWEPPPW